MTTECLSCSAKNILDSKYICNFNSYLKLPHLYLNSYFSPCGNSACLNCIYLNYNLYNNSIKCNFDNCKQEHKLSQKLVKNEKLMEVIGKNCQELLKCLIVEEKIVIINSSILFSNHFFSIYSFIFRSKYEPF